MLPVLGSFIQVLIFNATIVKAFSRFLFIFFNLENVSLCMDTETMC